MEPRSLPPGPLQLSEEAEAVALAALAESRLRGLPAAEEYRVVADRLYRSGFRDVGPTVLVAWIERAVAENYAHYLALRALGDRIFGALASGDVARVAWELASELDSEARARLIAGLQRIDELERDTP